MRPLAGGVPSVVLHPGHICGPGWPVITPAGNLDADVWRRLAVGEPVALPALGLGVLHHVHADDVAQAFERALTRPAAIGASFHVVAEQAMTCRGLAEGVAAWFGREAVLDFVDWDEFERRVGPEHAAATLDHIDRSIAASIERSRAILGLRPAVLLTGGPARVAPLAGRARSGGRGRTGVLKPSRRQDDLSSSTNTWWAMASSRCMSRSLGSSDTLANGSCVRSLLPLRCSACRAKRLFKRGLDASRELGDVLGTGCGCPRDRRPRTQATGPPFAGIFYSPLTDSNR